MLCLHFHAFLHTVTLQTALEVYEIGCGWVRVVAQGSHLGFYPDLLSLTVVIDNSVTISISRQIRCLLY